MTDRVDDGRARGRDVEWLPSDARIVVLVTAGVGEWAGPALELADLIGLFRRRTILVNTISGPAGPDPLLSAASRPGLTAALSGSASIPEIALTPPECAFTYVPAGSPAIPFRRLRALPALGRLAERVRRGGGTLLILVDEDDLGRGPASGLEGRVDGCVHLGPVDAGRTRSLDWPLLARVEAPPLTRPARASDRGGQAAEAQGEDAMPIAQGGASAGKESLGVVTAAARGERPRSWWRLSELRAVAVVWAAAVVLVWVLWQGLSGWPAFAPGFPETTPRESTVRAEVPGEEGPGGVHGGAEGVAGEATAETAERSPEDDADATAHPFGGVELPYSVLLVSYVDLSDAEALRERLARSDELFFIAPTVIRGRLYHRVMAGALADRSEAQQRMKRLVADGVKEREREWDVRPVRFAFAVGDFADARAAQELRDRLHDAGLPSYVLSDGGSPTVYRVYSGAFESTDAAAGLDDLLRTAGYAPELLTRRGESR